MLAEGLPSSLDVLKMLSHCEEGFPKCYHITASTHIKLKDYTPPKETNLLKILTLKPKQAIFSWQALATMEGAI